MFGSVSLGGITLHTKPGIEHSTFFMHYWLPDVYKMYIDQCLNEHATYSLI